MCLPIFGSSKQQAQPALPPPPAPAPLPTPADPNPTETAQQRRQRIEGIKRGAASTVKTGGEGITGAGPDLNTPTAAGLMFPSMQKKTTGS